MHMNTRRNGSPLWCMAECIIQEINECLFQLGGISQKKSRGWADGMQMDAFFLREHRQLTDHFFDQWGEI